MSGSYKVNLEDKFTLDYLLIKHYQLWQDIQQNRINYVGSLSDSDWLFESGFDEDLHNKTLKEHIDKQLANITLESQRLLVKETLKELFPELKHILDDQPKSHMDFSKLQHERRVAHPDVLDTYFGSSTRDEVYSSQTRKVEKNLANADKQNDAQLRKSFLGILADADDSNEDANIVTLSREFLLRNFSGETLVRILAVWLRVYLKSTGYLVREDNQALVRILSAINSAIEREPLERRQQLLHEVFKDIASQIKHPSSGLRLLLYVHPSRDNHLYVIKGYEQMAELFNSVLRFVDDFYFEAKKDNIFTEAGGVEAGDWRFIVYQWALSVSNDGKINEQVEVEFPTLRFDNVNNYIFGLLESNDELAYKVIKRQFWTTDLYDINDGQTWSVAGNIHPYDSIRLEKLTKKLISPNSKLKTNQKNDLKDFHKKLAF